ncbi:MAG: GIY-YIG nuclease family protein [Nitrospirae bacterium]|nr:GIY-YIG nuclease family protein [Nitrospirota bacterium]
MKQKVGSKPQSLVIKRLENISKDVFKKHSELITKLVGNTHGVYALYDGSELYYVGKSTDLKKRVNQHLRDKHLASWTHFSLYLVRDESHIHEIESLLIRIANPKGNTKLYKSQSGNTLKRELVTMLKEKHKDEIDSIVGRTRRRTPNKKSNSKHPESLTGLVKNKATLYRAYKGKEYKAILTGKGIIKLGSKRFTSPSGAALSIVDSSTVNGWDFWYIKNASGEWVRLSDFQ